MDHHGALRDGGIWGFTCSQAQGAASLLGFPPGERRSSPILAPWAVPWQRQLHPMGMAEGGRTTSEWGTGGRVAMPAPTSAWDGWGRVGGPGGGGTGLQHPLAAGTMGKQALVVLGWLRFVQQGAGFFPCEPSTARPLCLVCCCSPGTKGFASPKPPRPSPSLRFWLLQRPSERSLIQSSFVLGSSCLHGAAIPEQGTEGEAGTARGCAGGRRCRDAQMMILVSWRQLRL